MRFYELVGGPSVRYIVIDRMTKETLCLTTDLEEAYTVWWEHLGYSAEVHAVPARARAIILSQRSRDAGMRAVEAVRCSIGYPCMGMTGAV
ncbi:MAG: hypothetical protein PHQ81_10700 [Methanofollis sp.]|nr:hypothetical protein [Methanofollis sp.]